MERICQRWDISFTMGITLDKILLLGAATFYGFAVIHASFLWRKGFKKDNFVNFSFILAAFLIHTSAMLVRGLAFSRCPTGNLFEASVFIGWCLTLIVLVTALFSRTNFIGAFASPLLFAVIIFSIMPGLDSPISSTTVQRTWLTLHITLTLLGYGALGLSAIAGLMFLVQENDLKGRRQFFLFSILPPLERLEWLIYKLMLGGFLLLTAGLVLGFVLVNQFYEVIYKPDLKILWSVLVWLMYLVVLVMFQAGRLSLRRFSCYSCLIYLFVLTTFWLTSVFSTIHQP